MLLVFEKSPEYIIRASLYKSKGHLERDEPYAFLWKRNEPGAVEALTEEAQKVTDAEAASPNVSPSHTRVQRKYGKTALQVAFENAEQR